MKDKEESVVDLAIVAVIAAAIASVMDQPHRVVEVKRVTVPAPHLNVWAFEGRVELSMSHRLR